MKVAIADPPYPGCCGLYGHHHEAPFGCWDDIAAHRKLIRRLRQDFDGDARLDRRADHDATRPGAHEKWLGQFDFAAHGWVASSKEPNNG